MTVLLSVTFVGGSVIGLALGLSWAAVALALIFTWALASVIGVLRRTSVAGIVAMVVVSHGLVIVGLFLTALVLLSTRPAGSKSM